MITKEQQSTVFNYMVLIAKEKNNDKASITVNQIVNKMKANGIETSGLIIRATLDTLIQFKLVRYWNNEAGIRFFCITTAGWERWNNRQTKSEKVGA